MCDFFQTCTKTALVVVMLNTGIDRTERTSTIRTAGRGAGITWSMEDEVRAPPIS